MNKGRATLYRKIDQLEKKLENERRRADRYKKRHQRVLLKNATAPTPLTTRSKTRRLLRFMSVSSDVRKTLLFHNVVVQNLHQKYVSLKSRAARRKFQKLFVSRTVKKYKMLSTCRSAFGFSGRYARGHMIPKPFGNKTDFCAKLKMQFKQYYLRDDVSRSTAGKKETITRKKVKMPKRFVLDNLENLHRKFLSENPKLSLSYSLFCRLRPFWVLLPDLKSRDTCLCKLHDNLGLMAQKLFKMHLVHSANLEDLVAKCCCAVTSKNCMYGLCPTCRDMHVSLMSHVDAKEPVAYKQWMVTVGEKKKQNETVYVKLTVKENVHEPFEKFIVKFNEKMKQFKKHFCNINHQFLQYRFLKGSLGDRECMIHIDFAENFSCKYFREIQSVHFGSSHSQATLHTGVYFIKADNDIKPTSFCTISDSKQHDPCGIWTYLDPVLKLIKEQHPAINVVHFFSDGPATQYRQKLNFYYFCTKIQSYGFVNGTWNFSEAGHGKGAADGVGGALKRTADKLISLQHDISCPKLLFDVLSARKSDVILFYVSADAVIDAVANMPSTVSAISGTMNIHQVLCTAFGQIRYRDVSCFCSFDKVSCTCYDVKDFSFICPCTTSSEQARNKKKE